VTAPLYTKWPPLSEAKWLLMWSIHKNHPKYPDRWAVKRWKIRGHRVTAHPATPKGADSIEEARQWVPPGKMQLKGAVLVKDASIIETWL
jgi:hypothetical protein